MVAADENKEQRDHQSADAQTATEPSPSPAKKSSAEASGLPKGSNAKSPNNLDFFLDIPIEVKLLGGTAIVVVFALLLALAGRSRRLGQGSSADAAAKPAPPPSPADDSTTQHIDAARTTPSSERKREHLAAAFAEQIEDLWRARLMTHPALVGLDVDLGTAADGSLEVFVDGQSYTDISQVPDKDLREALLAAVSDWRAARQGEEGES